MTQLDSKSILIPHFSHRKAIKANNLGGMPPRLIIFSNNKHISNENTVNFFDSVLPEHASFQYFIKFAQKVRLALIVAPYIDMEALKVTLEQLGMRPYPFIKLRKRKTT